VSVRFALDEGIFRREGNLFCMCRITALFATVLGPTILAILNNTSRKLLITTLNIGWVLYVGSPLFKGAASLEQAEQAQKALTSISPWVLVIPGGLLWLWMCFDKRRRQPQP
jgi:hypothetical protein